MRQRAARRRAFRGVAQQTPPAGSCLPRRNDTGGDVVTCHGGARRESEIRARAPCSHAVDREEDAPTYLTRLVR